MLGVFTLPRIKVKEEKCVWHGQRRENPPTDHFEREVKRTKRAAFLIGEASTPAPDATLFFPRISVPRNVCTVIHDVYSDIKKTYLRTFISHHTKCDKM